MWVAEKDKQHLLQHLLENEPIDKAIVFTRTKYRADRVKKKLDQAGFSAIAIHSNRTQGQRQRALKGFEEGQYRVLVATDIAARGLDFDRDPTNASPRFRRNRVRWELVAFWLRRCPLM